MSEKINVLVYTTDGAGVAKFRSLMPHLSLQKNHSEDFFIEINNNVDWNDDNYLKKFQIIHFHRTMCNFDQMEVLCKKLDSLGIIYVMDIDDYWMVQKTHPAYEMVKGDGLADKTINNLKLAKYVTTTTPIFADYIKKYNQNIVVLPNAIDPEEKQFQPNSSKSNLIRIGYLGGSSHLADLTLLKDAFNILDNDSELKGKYQVVLCGFDTRGSITNFNILPEDLIKDLQLLNIWTQQMMNAIVSVQGNLDKINGIPDFVKDKWRGKLPEKTTRPITPKESVWYEYEKIFTDNYTSITDKKYIEHLDKFKNEQYPDEESQPYRRVWTKGVNTYASNYNLFDISLAPLVYSRTEPFNTVKSQLKLLEAGFHKKAVICSDAPPYLIDGVHEKNCFMVREGRDRDWAKYIKRLILNPDLIKEMGEALYNTVKDTYHIDTVTKTRAEFYKSIVKK